MRALDEDALAQVTGGAGRTWGKVAVDYARACADGALTAATMAPPAPQVLGIGCAGGVAAQGLIDGVRWARGQ